LDVARVGVISEQEWRACWSPTEGAESEAEPIDVIDAADEPPAEPEEVGTEAVATED
jgi:hypothetical protein